MVGENKTSVFENWLSAYGSRLEEIATTRLSEPRKEQDAEAVSSPKLKQKQSH